MATTDPRIDAYIARAQPFARPILERLRALVHSACPEVIETIKWGHPSFDHHGMLCGMAAFKAHCTFGFWRHALVEQHLGAAFRPGEAWGQLGCLTSLADLPSATLLRKALREAARLNIAGIKAPPRATAPRRRAIRVPPDLAAALARDTPARVTFEGLPPSHRREYVEWITEAKREATRQRRLATTLEWLRAGKSRNWKYERPR